LSGRAALNELTATEIVSLTQSGAVSAEDVVRSCLDRIRHREETVSAWTFVDADSAIAQAREVDRRGGSGALCGVPVGIKDIIATVDMPTAFGSPIYANHRPAWDASCVAAIRAAGGVILGKTVTTEFASSYPGKTVHPKDPARTPGGSSSGSAAAVADFMCPVAIGTQTGGSVIRPASYCGIAGYKPSFGWVNRHGVKPLSESLDTVGALARTVEDAARAVAVMAGRPALLQLAEIEHPKIAIWRSSSLEHAEPDMTDCIEETAKRLSTAGASVSDIEPPPVFAEADAAHHEIEYFEMGRALAFELQAFPGLLSPALRKRVEAEQACHAEVYDRKRSIARDCRAALASLFETFDAILTPAAGGAAPKGLSSTGNALFNRIWTMTHAPTVTIPGVWDIHGMPLGIQFIGPLDDDSRVLAVACFARRALTK
jgi:amidase